MTEQHGEVIEILREELARERIARLEAESGARAKASLLARMSHEIRTPLNAIIGMTALLVDTALDAEQREYAETVRQSGEHLLSLIDDILEFSRIDADRFDIDSVPFDLRACVEEALDLVSLPAATKGLELACFVDPEAPTNLVGDPRRIRQILVNLTGNAIKFTDSGEVSVTATVAALGDGRLELRVRVQDTGIGIPTERIPSLFEPFRQLGPSTAQRYGGSGLGLAIVQRLCRLMGGTARLESEPGRGTTATFTAIVGRGDAPPGADDGARGSLLGKRLLIVDASATGRQVLAAYTAHWGMTSREAASAEEAVAILASGETVDLAIVDLKIATGGETDVCARLRGLPGRSELAVIVAGAVGDGMRDACPDAEPVSGWATKPLKFSALHRVIRQALTGGAGIDLAATAPPDATSESGSDHPLRILLAEDNPVNQKVALRLLERLGYSPVLASDGLAALAMASAERFDVVLLDVQMPGLDGFEVARELRRRRSDAARPRIVAMTAHAMAGDRERCLAAGMDEYIAKPVRLDVLASVLGRVVAPSTERSALPPGPVDAEIFERFRESMGDDDGARDIVSDCIDAVERGAQELCAAWVAGEDEVAERAAHDLKSTALMVGAIALAQMAREIERTYRDDGRPTLDVLELAATAKIAGELLRGRSTT
jgi:CheY-like chemotaxis protein/HPt (histidine-containing phosphotransfer) domain-containing protein